MTTHRSAIAAVLVRRSLGSSAAQGPAQPALERMVQPLAISSNGRFFQTDDGRPFFWLGDTGWLIFERVDRQEAETRRFEPPGAPRRGNDWVLVLVDAAARFSALGGH